MCQFLLAYAFQSASPPRRHCPEVATPVDLKAAGQLGGVVHKQSTDAEYDHSLSLMCALREQKICGTVYALQNTYNKSHAGMHEAGEAAESAFDHWEASKKTCADLMEKVEEINEAARTGKKVCRERVKEVGTDLVGKLKDVRDRLLAADDEDGGRCSKKDLFEATKVLKGEDLAAENSGRGKGEGKVVGIERKLEDGTDVKVGDDENSTTIVLGNGFVMPEVGRSTSRWMPGGPPTRRQS